MADNLVIALDAMGGDDGPRVVIPGAAIALERRPGLRFLLFGDEAAVAPVLAAHPRVAAASELRHAEVAIAMDDKPSQALRRGRKVSSMWCALEAVKAGEAAAAVSAGNTGALMAMAKLVLDTMPGVARPAIAGQWPTLRGKSIVLDMGATIGADAAQLVDNAIMGAAMARCLMGLERPSVALLNVGVEEIKGVEEVREAGRRLRAASLPLDYAGFVEGNDIGTGKVDVIVPEGFTGNIALKTAEGTARQISSILRQEMNRNLFTRIGYLFARGAFDAVRRRMDPRVHNGGVMLGLNGIVVKSHGTTDAAGFASAVGVATDMADNGLVGEIAAGVAIAREQMLDAQPAAVAAVQEG